MNIPEEFGDYLLLKKLTEDPLGETFRAGKVGRQGMEQVVLLRVFNGKGLDGEKLWSKISGRAGVQQILKSPNIGSGADLGRVRSFPYVAYDYISGKNLAAVFAQSARQFSPVPTDHALLIAERISLALAAACESRWQDERVLHGFVVPQLVMVSNEGETRLLGFEAAPGLRELAAGGWQDASLQPYLSPETLTGTPLSRADDVYSLGAILYELLTGERLPVGSGAPAEAFASYSALIDDITLPNEGTPLPPPVAALLKKSLTSREQRIPDAVTWHKTLSKLMIDGHFSPTTFNLAFFMHNLFREEIERESQEMQAEKNLELPSRTPAVPMPVAVPASPAAALRQTPGVREGTLPGARVQAPVPAPSKKGLWIGLAAVLLIGAAIAAYFLFLRPETGTQTAAALPEAQLTPQPVSQPGSTPAAGPTTEELETRIQELVEARSKDMEARFKSQYDDRIKGLQQQLEDTRRSGSERSAPVQDLRPSAPPPEPEPERPATRTEPAASSQPQASPPAPQPAATPPPQVEKNDKPAVPAPAAANPVPASPAPAPRQQVQLGDLVQPGPGVSPPKLQGQLDPRYPPAAQRLNRAAQVDIKVLVDERGRVMNAERLGGKAGFGFDEAALDAARRATFQAATKDGVRVKMWMTLRVNFKPPVR